MATSFTTALNRIRGKRAAPIAVVTGTRAELGLLLPMMCATEAHGALRLQTIVTGTHWTTGTWRDVYNAGFAINARVRM